MSNTPNTDTLEDQAREFYVKSLDLPVRDMDAPVITLMADFARHVAKEAVRRREIEISHRLSQLVLGTPDTLAAYAAELRSE